MVPHGCQTDPSGLHGLQQRFSTYQLLKPLLMGLLQTAQFQLNNKVFRFVQLLQKKVSQQGPITAIEYDHAMTEWVKNRQSVVFRAEVDNLLSKEVSGGQLES